MNDLIRVTVNENQEPIISGRELHKFLEVGTDYKKWFDRMAEYGFVENVDFATVSQKCPIANGGYQERYDHLIKIDMEKELCMIQRTERGKQARRYFIEVEKEYNSPEKVMARALKIAEMQLSNLRLENKVQAQQIQELTPKASYYDKVLQCKEVVSISVIAKDYGMSAKKLNSLLHNRGVQYKQGHIWLLYQKYANKGYTKTKTYTSTTTEGDVYAVVHTYWTQKGRLFIYDLLKQENIYPTMER